MELNIKKRTVIKLGDIFVAKLDDCQKYFQYVADDMTMLNSRVIRVFEEKYPLGSMPDLTEIAQGDIDFYAHTSVKLGIKLGLWDKIGNSPVFGEIDVIFRRSKDYTENNKVKISERWEVWRINEEFRYVGKLKGENRNAEIGLVEPPVGIIHRMKTGEYYGCYPGFE
ncbi:MAG: hypothetical protein LBD80_03185 [Tannerella sp.]|jgi:hypothetical protein|nr:hypothetical protein [Tannerella sp.]